MKACDMEGKVFGRLTVIKRDGSTKAKKAKWLCECECGEETHAISAQLNNGSKLSCGCLQSDYARARLSDIPLASKRWNREAN